MTRPLVCGRASAALVGFALVASSVALSVLTVAPGVAAAQSPPGSLDSSFGSASTPGMVSSTAGDGATGVAYDAADAGEVAVSSGSSTSPPQFEVGMFTSSGVADTNFANGFSPFLGSALAVTAIPAGAPSKTGGNVVAAGYIKPSSQTCGDALPVPVIAEYTPAGSQVFQTDLRAGTSRTLAFSLTAGSTQVTLTPQTKGPLSATDAGATICFSDPTLQTLTISQVTNATTAMLSAPAISTATVTATVSRVDTGQLNAVTIDPQGNIVAAGQTTTATGASEGLVVRLTPAGVLDTTFNGTGYVATFAVADGQAAEFNSVAVVPPVPANFMPPPTDVGDIVAGGDSTTTIGQALTVAAFNGITGAPDPNFGTAGAGAVLFPGASTASGLAVISGNTLGQTPAPLGNIVAVGPSSSNPTGAIMAQFLPSGAMDSTFGTGGSGQVTVQPSAQSAGAAYQLNAVAYDPFEGFLTATGISTTTKSQSLPQPPQVQSTLVGQYNALNGAPNTFFGPNGLVVEPAANNEPAGGAAVAVQPDGKTIVAGETPTVNGVEAISLMRFMGAAVSLANAAPTVLVPPGDGPPFQSGTLSFTASLTEPLPLTACPMLSATGPGTVKPAAPTCPAPTVLGIGPGNHSPPVTSATFKVIINMAGVPPGSVLGEQVKVISGNGLFAGTNGTSTASGTVQRVFSLMSGAATQISVGANGATWVVGTNSVPGGGGIFHWNGSGWVHEPGAAVGIAVDPSGNPWVINSGHSIFHWNGSGWVLYPGLATAISVGANGSLWAIGTKAAPGGNGIYYFNGTWVQVPGGAVGIAVDPTGEPWVINLSHTIFES